jgi:hypothetical protein
MSGGRGTRANVSDSKVGDKRNAAGDDRASKRLFTTVRYRVLETSL